MDKGHLTPPGKGGGNARRAKNGAERRDAGCRRAIEAAPNESLDLQIRLLKTVQIKKTATIDDVTDAEHLIGRFARRGPWRGASVSALISRKLVRVVRFERTRRKHRHHGWNKVLVATDPAKLPAAITRLEDQLADLRRLTGGGE